MRVVHLVQVLVARLVVLLELVNQALKQLLGHLGSSGQAEVVGGRLSLHLVVVEGMELVAQIRYLP